MGPLFLIPVAAMLALAAITGDKPNQPAEDPGLVAFRKTYECGLYNKLREVDAQPPSYKYRFVVLAMNRGQEYDQVWMDADHHKVNYEVSSRFYEHKSSEPREYWPTSVQDVVVRHGFDLKSGADGNYRKVVEDEHRVDLHALAADMLDILYQAFKPGITPPLISFGHTRDALLPANAVCLPEQAAPEPVAEGGR